MDALIEEAWRIYRKSEDEVVVKPSIPILFFGDSEQYVRSPLRVITVALNPSRKEFPEDDRFSRFRLAERIDPECFSEGDYSDYLAALNNYYRNDPYTGWFRWFDAVLRGLGASYYDGHGNVALHTDLCSPLATDPTWSNLGELQEQFQQEGMALWHRLVECLTPDVIVVSVARRYRDQIGFSDPNGWEPIVTIPRSVETKRPYTAWAQEVTLPGGKTAHMLFGQAAQQPFATLKDAERRRIGRSFLEYVNGR